MADIARAHGRAIDVPTLAAELDRPAVETVAIRPRASSTASMRW